MEPARKTGSARGSALLAASRIWAQGASAILFLATSAMIDPSQFGEFAIATSIFAVLAVGVGHGTYEYVMKERQSDTAPPTVFFINMGTATLASLAALVISVLIPYVVKGPEIGMILTLLTPAFFLMGTNTLMESVVMKRGEITKVAVAGLVTETLALGVALAALASGAGVLALVFQRVTREGTIVLVYAGSCSWRPWFTFDIGEARKALVFTRDILTTRFIQLGQTAVVDVVIGGALSTADAGLFRLVARLLTAGSDILFQPFRASMWVSLPPLQNDPANFGKTALNLLEVFGIGLFAAMIGASLIVAPTFELILDPAWQGAIPVFYALALARVIGLPLYATEVVFALTNRTTFMAGAALIVTILTVAAAFLTAHAGLYVFSLAVVVVTIINELIVLPVMAKSGNMPLGTLFQLMARLSLNAVAMVAVAGPWLMLGPQLGLTHWPLVGSTVLIGAVVYVLAARKFTPAGYLAYEEAFMGALGYLRIPHHAKAG